MSSFSSSSTSGSSGFYSTSSTSSSSPSDSDFLQRLSRIQGLLIDLENRFKKNGIWLGELEKGKIPKGQAQMQELIEDCHSLVEEIQEDLEKGSVKERIQPHVHEQEKGKQKESMINRRKKRAAKKASELDSETLSELSPEMVGPYKEMLSVFYDLADLCSTGSGNPDNLRHLRRLQGLLDNYETKYKHGGNIWCGDLAQRNIPSGQALLNELCDSSHDLIEELNDEFEIRSGVPEHEPEKRHSKRQEKKNLRQQKKRAGAGAGASTGGDAAGGEAPKVGAGAGAGGRGGWEIEKEKGGQEATKEKGSSANAREARVQ